MSLTGNLEWNIVGNDDRNIIYEVWKHATGITEEIINPKRIKICEKVGKT